MTKKFDADDAEIAVEDGDYEPIPIEEVDFELGEGDREVAMMDWGTGATEFSGSFTVEGEAFASMLAEAAFEDGLSVRLADDLDDILSGDEEELPDLNELAMPDVSPEVVDELDVDAGQAETLLKVVYQRLDDHQAEYGELPSQIVVGLPQFKTLEAYVQSQRDMSLEQRLPVDEVIVVPGPQLHTVRDPYRMVEEDMTDESE
jgi:hypothetical protein